IKFAISYIPNFIIQNIVVIIVFNIFNYDKIIAYILAAIIGVPVTFVLMKFFVFRKR
ncbi:GtrA family protein, partial [Clostridium neonatale]|uniref:GtrA family protein n=1 Tax=Clostridium neonatale TaxID=137838 RepID=UPI003D34255E